MTDYIDKLLNNIAEDMKKNKIEAQKILDDLNEEGEKNGWIKLWERLT